MRGEGQPGGGELLNAIFREFVFRVYSYTRVWRGVAHRIRRDRDLHIRGNLNRKFSRARFRAAANVQTRTPDGVYSGLPDRGGGDRDTETGPSRVSLSLECAHTTRTTGKFPGISLYTCIHPYKSVSPEKTSNNKKKYVRYLWPYRTIFE